MKINMAKKMKSRITIWAAFVFFVMMILMATVILTYIICYIALGLRLPETPVPIPLRHPMAGILFVSIILGSLMSGIIGKRLMKSIYELRDATRQVASGDFSVRIKEDKRIFEINSLVQDFNKMVKDLGSMETLKDDFITGVSHEIKTPIASIEGCVELLKEQTLTEEEMLEYINLIQINTKRLSVLVSNVLRLSKLENQQILPDKIDFSLDEQIRQAILLLERQWSAKEINFSINLNPARICANEELLMLVWTNLIDNAIKFSDKGGEILIKTFKTNDGRVCVKITDFGIGMKEETMKYMFQKFYQGNESRSNNGNGLGLSLVKRVVELSGGKISAESKLGKGSTFLVEL